MIILNRNSKGKSDLKFAAICSYSDKQIFIYPITYMNTTDI